MMMSNIEQKDPRFKNLEKKVGIFVFTAFVILAGILFFMGRERGLFIKKYAIFFTVDSGTGFIEGIPVKLLGFKVGKVKSLELTEDAKVKVTLEINKKYQKKKKKKKKKKGKKKKQLFYCKKKKKIAVKCVGVWLIRPPQ